MRTAIAVVVAVVLFPAVLNAGIGTKGELSSKTQNAAPSKDAKPKAAAGTPQQIELEFRLVQVNESKARTFSDAVLPLSNATGPAGSANSDADDSAKFNRTMKALEDEGVVKTLLGPRITLKDRQEGVVNIGSAASSGTTDAHSFFNLRCVPTILEDGSIQIKGHLEADRDYVGLSISRKADSDTQSQTIHQEFSRIVPSHPIGLCAVNGSRHQELTSGVPILRNLPLVGGLFRKTKTSTESVTTILFATARIVPLKA